MTALQVASTIQATWRLWAADQDAKKDFYAALAAIGPNLEQYPRVPAIAALFEESRQDGFFDRNMNSRILRDATIARSAESVEFAEAGMPPLPYPAFAR